MCQKNILGSKIRDLRKARAMTQTGLANACDLSPSQIGKIERGIHAPQASNLKEIAKALGVPHETLLCECTASDQAGLGSQSDDPKVQKAVPPALLILLKTSDDGNAYGFECIEVLQFNYDGQGSALVRMDGELDSLHPNDLDYVLHGNEDGVRWYRPVWQSPDLPDSASPL